MYPSEAQTIGAQAGLATKGSELERLAGVIVRQRDIISGLENRLSPVRHTAPSNSTATEQNMTPHISSLIDAVDRNNNYLMSILESLAI